MESIARYDVLIVGAGHGGAQAAIALRQQGFAGSIAMVGDEAHLPYERPPLSKEYFSGEKAWERLLIRPPRFWDDRQIDMLLEQRVIAVDAEQRRIVTDRETTLDYGKLVWATGGTPRMLTLPGGDLQGVQGVRTRADADAMKTRAASAQHVVIIGGGYIGLEAAAVLTKAGKRVVLLEALPRVLARVAGEELSEFFAGEHRAHGVDIRLSAVVESIEGDTHATGVRLASGEVIPADLVIVGIGIIPAVGPLRDAGASGTNGVEVDDHCRTSLPDVFAIGDCALHVNAFAQGASVRLESVQNANDMATTVAKTICDAPQPYSAVPWFWSHQYDLKLQTVGIAAGYDATVVRGTPASRSFSVIYLLSGRVIALDCVNAVKDYVQGRALVTGSVVASPSLLANTDVPLKQLATPDVAQSPE